MNRVVHSRQGWWTNCTVNSVGRWLGLIWKPNRRPICKRPTPQMTLENQSIRWTKPLRVVNLTRPAEV